MQFFFNREEKTQKSLDRLPRQAMAKTCCKVANSTSMPQGDKRWVSPCLPAELAPALKKPEACRFPLAGQSHGAEHKVTPSPILPFRLAKQILFPQLTSVKRAWGQQEHERSSSPVLS
jgi:hypothetical protein